jgi:hypothetical protein
MRSVRPSEKRSKNRRSTVGKARRSVGADQKMGSEIAATVSLIAAKQQNKVSETAGARALKNQEQEDASPTVER